MIAHELFEISLQVLIAAFLVHIKEVKYAFLKYPLILQSLYSRDIACVIPNLRSCNNIVVRFKTKHLWKKWWLNIVIFYLVVLTSHMGTGSHPGDSISNPTTCLWTGKPVEDSSIPWVPVSMRETQRRLLTLGFRSAQFWLLQTFGE